MSFAESGKTFFKKLTDFSDKYSKNYFIVSSRPESDFMEFQRFTVLELCNFTKGQAVSLVSKIDFDTEIKEKFIEALDSKLYDEHTSFASNPLLLNVMLLTYENYAEIPEKVHLFYDYAFETLIQKHDATKGGFQRNFKTNLSSDNFKKIISKFCFITYYHNKLKFTHDELVAFLKNSKSKDVDFSYEDMIADLKNAICFIYKEGIYYYFTHRSFQEYFTAVFLRELTDEKMEEMGLKLIDKDPHRTTHDKTFFMLYDMTTDRFEQNILIPLLESIEKNNTDDKYDFYFNFVKPEFSFVMFDDNEVHPCLFQSCDDLTEFVKDFSYKYKEINYKNAEANDNKLLEYLTKHNGYEISQNITYENIIKDKYLYEIFKSTWIGELINNIAGLKEYLKDKKRENAINLEELLNLE